MYGSARQLGDGTNQRRYRCRAMNNYGVQIGCGKMYRSADPLEAWITEAVFYRFDTPEVASALIDTEDTDDTVELVKAHQEAKAQLDQMVADYASGFLSRSQFAVAKGVAEDRVQHTREALTRIQRSRIPGLPVGIETLRESWDTAGLDWKRSVIRLLVDRVVVHPTPSGGSHYWRSWKFQPDAIEIVWVV